MDGQMSCQATLFLTHTRTHTLVDPTAMKTMNLEGNIETHSCNHCCSWKTIIIKYSECVCVALGIQQAMRMRHIVICDLPGSNEFFHIIS